MPLVVSLVAGSSTETVDWPPPVNLTQKEDSSFMEDYSLDYAEDLLNIGTHKEAGHSNAHTQ